MIIIIKTFRISTSRVEAASSGGGKKYQSACGSFMPNERIAESIVVAAVQAFKSFFSSR
jgi:hypothetical protein